MLTEENVKLQIKHLKSLALIRNMHAKGSLPRIHGWLYRVETGTVDVLIDGRGETPRSGSPAKALKSVVAVVGHSAKKPAAKKTRKR